MLALNDSDTAPDLGTLLETAEFYRLRQSDARDIMASVVNIVANWQKEAKRLGLSAEERADFEHLLQLETP